MKYKKFDVSYDPVITGINNGGAQLELKENKSFISKEEKNKFNKYIDENLNNRDRVFLKTFKSINEEQISSIKYYPTRKKIKRTDFISYLPYEFGLNYIISEKAYDVIKMYKIPSLLNKINIGIEGWENDKFYLIGFPMIPDTEIDLKKSIFYDTQRNEKVNFKSYQDYNEINFNLVALNLFLLNKYHYDIINIQGKGMFFSEELIYALKGNNIIGFEIREIILEN